jgi:hypothetical protein
MDDRGPGDGARRPSNWVEGAAWMPMDSARRLIMRSSLLVKVEYCGSAPFRRRPSCSAKSFVLK